MITGLPRWDAPDAYYSQTNNVVETILAKVKADRKLETCGPTAAVMLVDAIGRKVTTTTPGAWEPQPEDILAAWMNDPRNYPVMRLARPELDPASVMGNEVPQYYPAALASVFGVPAVFSWGLDYSHIFRAIDAGRGILAALENPGHYIAIVGYEAETNDVIYHDPWPGNPWPARLRGQPGSRRHLNGAELENLKGYRVEIG